MRYRLPALALAFCLGAALPASGASPAVALATLPLLGAGRLATVCIAALGWSARTAAEPPASRPRPPPGPRAGEVWLEGTVDGAPERFADRVRFTLRCRDGSRYLVWAAAPPLPVAIGDELRLAARLRVPEGARNPGGRDPAAALRARGIALEAFASGEPIRVARPSPLARLEAARHAFARAASAHLPPREAALVTAIATGERDGIDAATNDAFARSGLAHLLSVSGLHLSVVVYGLYRVLRYALLRCDAVACRWNAASVAAAAAVPFTALYAVATGASVPVVRSAIATSVGFAALLLGRETRALDTVALALVAIVACDPGAMADPSLQLSFASVAALATLARPLRAALPLAPPPPGASWPRRCAESLLASLCASAAASIATAPIVACHFRRLPLAGVLANVPGVPIGSALTVAATAAALTTCAVPVLSPALLRVCHPLAWALLAVNDLFANLPGAAPAVASPGPLCAAACIGCGALAWRTRGAGRCGFAIAAVALLLAPGPFRAWAAAARGDVLEVLFLGVGQGDCAVLRLPDGAAVLIDAGGDARAKLDPGTRDVVPFLRDAGVRRIAAVFLSHADADHVVALPAIAQAFEIDAVFTSGADVDERAGALLAGAPPPRHLSAGDVWSRAGVRFEVLAPGSAGAPLDENDASLVVRVVHGRSALLFMGDVERRGEDALLATAGAPALRADVVKVAHHGSATSSGEGLVDAVRPAIAVLSLGKDNRFGFPARAVVDRWVAAGAAIARTDAGAVRILSDARGVRLTPAGAALSGVALLRERL